MPPHAASQMCLWETFAHLTNQVISHEAVLSQQIFNACSSLPCRVWMWHFWDSFSLSISRSFWLRDSIAFKKLWKIFRLPLLQHIRETDPTSDGCTPIATPGSVSWAAFGEQLGQSNEQQSWKAVTAVGGVWFAKEEWEDPELTHASAPSLQANEKKRQRYIIFEESNPLSFMLFLLLVILDIYQPSPLLENFPGEDIVSFKHDWWKTQNYRDTDLQNCTSCKLKGWMPCCALLPSTDNSSNDNIYTFSQLNKYAHERVYEKTDLHHCNAFIHPGQDRIHLIVPVCVWIQLKYT